MTFIQLLEIANKGYPEVDLMECIHEDANGVIHIEVNGELGDTLAEFVVQELYDTFDPDARDIKQLACAEVAIEKAVNDLQKVLNTLDQHALNMRGKRYGYINRNQPRRPG